MHALVLKMDAPISGYGLSKIVTNYMCSVCQYIFHPILHVCITYLMHTYSCQCTSIQQWTYSQIGWFWHCSTTIWDSCRGGQDHRMHPFLCFPWGEKLLSTFLTFENDFKLLVLIHTFWPFYGKPSHDFIHSHL